MSKLIADARRAVGWSMRDLAEHLDVNVSSVSRMEASERDGTIGVGTLNRALEVMGFNLRLASAPARREDRVALELHRSVAEKLRIDPDAVLSHVAGNLARLREVTQGDLVQGWLDQWEQLTTASIDTLIDGMLEQSSLGRELRQNSPFAGALTRDERLAAIERAKQS